MLFFLEDLETFFYHQKTLIQINQVWLEQKMKEATLKQLDFINLNK